MGKRNTNKNKGTNGPAAFPANDAVDRETISKLEYMLNKDSIKSELNKSDKFPNIDGRITLTNLNRPAGTIEVQVKTLSEKNNTDPKHQCTREFLHYCTENTNVPILLIIVSKIDDCAYWIHMESSLAKSKIDEIKPGKNSINIKIPVTNVISKNDDRYIKIWQEIIDKARKIYIDYGRLERGYNEVQQQFKLITNDSVNVISEENDEVTASIQKYFTINNSLWDSSFNVIKDILYPNVWKFGVGYSEYNESKLTSSNYPILYGKNMLPIMKFRDMDSLAESEHFSMSYHTENPIAKEPTKYAYKNIGKHVMSFLEKEYLIKSKPVVIENIFSFLLKNKNLLQISPQPRYHLHTLYISLIDKQTELQRGGINISSVIMMVKYLMSIGDKTVESLYLSAHPQRIQIRDICYQYIQETWSDFMNVLFPNIKHKFKLFGPGDYNVIIVDPVDLEKTNIFNFQTQGETQKSKTILSNHQYHPGLSRTAIKKLSEEFNDIDGHQRKLRTFIEPSHIFTGSTPLLDLTKKTVLDSVKNFFELNS